MNLNLLDNMVGMEVVCYLGDDLQYLSFMVPDFPA
jgi:hypothetical protein